MKKGGLIFLIILDLFFIAGFVGLIKASAIPTVGGDTDTWGTVLNNYLQTEHNASGQHANITALDIITKNPFTDVRAFGAKGDGITNDTASIQAAMDFVESQGGGTLFFPQGTYLVNSTIIWKNGVRLEGEQGGYNVPGRFPEIKWNGAENGTLILAEQINDNWHTTDASRLVFRGRGSSNPKTLIRFQDRVDYGTSFWKCQFSNTNGDAIIFPEGATNLYMYDFRADGIGGYLIYINGSGSDIYSLDKFTYDTGATAEIAKGLIFLDGIEAPNNAVKKILISNTKLEVNANLSGDNNSLILFGVNTAISDYIQYQLVLDNVWVAKATAVEDISLVRSTPASDQFTVVGTNVFVGSNDVIIKDSITPGPIQNKIQPFFVFAPFISGAPASNNNLISLISNLYIWGNVGIGTRESTTDRLTINGSLTVNGSLKIQNSSSASMLYLNDSTGNMGIGTSTPTFALDIRKIASTINIGDSGTGVNQKYFGFQSVGGTLYGYSFSDAFNSMAWIQVVKLAASSYFIDYINFPNGRIGLGTTVPSARLDINDTTTVPLKLASNTTAIICNSTSEGGIMYSNASKKHYGCNGTDWNTLY